MPCEPRSPDEKLTVIDEGSAEANRACFRLWVFEKDLALFVVLGDDIEAEALAELATRNSGGPQEPSWVLWVKHPEQISEDVEELDEKDRIEEDVIDLRAVTVTRGNVVCRVFRHADPPPDQFDVVAAFVEAVGGCEE